MNQNPTPQSPSTTTSPSDEPERPKERAFLMHLTGQGDTYAVLIDAATLRFIENGGRAPGYLVKQYAASHEVTEEEARKTLEDTQGSTVENDRALCLTAGSLWKTGERYSKFHLNVNEINRFCEENNLTLEERTYEGAIY